MNGKRPADPGPARPMKKGKKQVSAEFSDAVTEEILRKQVAEAWSCRTPFSHDWILGLWIWKELECFKWDLISHPSRNMEDFVAKSDLNCGDLAQKISV
uniref:prolyl 3-hydroxylase OGFOD1 isoform 13 n=1 Tax=Mus musculus TaxID=10090 RepID=UPI00300F8078